MNRLTPEQLGTLHAALVDAFDDTNLPMLVRFSCPADIVKEVDWKTDLKQMAQQIIEKLEQRGDLDSLLRGMVKARPKRNDIQTFCQLYFPTAFEDRPQAVLVTQVKTGLTALIGALKDPAVRLTMGRFKEGIEAARSRIRTVSAYKKLHDSLHNLDQRLDSITLAVDAFPSNPQASALHLRRSINDLRREAARARDAVPSTTLPDVEMVWIDEWDGAIDDLDRAVKKPSPDYPLGPLVTALARLVENAKGINRSICLLAADMRLSVLVDALTTLSSGTVANGAAEGPAGNLLMGLNGLKGLQAEFARRVTEHQEWQNLDTDLRAADTSPEHEPKKKVPKWDRFRARLTRLCELFPNEPWSKELLAQEREWENAAAAGDRSASLIEAGSFRAMASNRFFDVDGELNMLCERLDDISALLDTLLGVLAYGQA